MLAQIGSAASFSLRGCRVPSKVHFTAKHLTVFGLFRIALSKRRGKKTFLANVCQGRISCARWSSDASFQNPQFIGYPALDPLVPLDLAAHRRPLRRDLWDRPASRCELRKGRISSDFTQLDGSALFLANQSSRERFE